MSTPAFPSSFCLSDWQAVVSAGPELAGGKGWGLARLAQLGLPVAPGLVLSAACFRKHQGWTREQSRDALQLLLFGVLAAKGWTDHVLAVRSSAVDEDGIRASHAGIFLSRLGVRGLPAVVEAVLEVWDSAGSATACAYRERLGLPVETAMAVVIMPMLDVESAGVAFSADPRDGRQDRLLLQANWGVGRSVVDGLAEADEYVFGVDVLDERLTLLKQSVGRKQIQVGTDDVVRHRTAAEGLDWTLTTERALELAGIVQDAARALDFARPLFDLEWAWDGRQFWLLQARPITALPRYGYGALVTQPRWWSSGNARDVVPLPLSALEWNGVRFMVEKVSTQYCRRAGQRLLLGLERARLIDGRVYLDLGLAQYEHWNALGIPPSEFNRELGGSQPEISVPSSVSHWQKMKWAVRWLRLMLVLPWLRWRADRLARRVSQKADCLRRQPWPQQADALLPVLRRMRRQAFEQDDLCFLQMPGVATGRLRQKMVLAFPDKGEALASTMLAMGPATVTAEQGRLLQLLAQQAQATPAVMKWLAKRHPDDNDLDVPDAAFREQLDAFLHAYGHRAVYESYMRQPRWHESPAYLLNCLSALCDVDPAPLAARQMQARTDAMAALQRLPRWQRWELNLLSRMAQQENCQRELARSTLIRLLDAGRQHYLRLGDVLAQRGVLSGAADVFDLTPGEVELAWSGSLAASAVQFRVAQRQQLRREWDAVAAPAWVQEGVESSADSTEQSASRSTSGDWQGQPVSAGVAQGPARVIRHPDQAHALRAGDILVCPSTDPAWTLLFLRASAVIMEVGGYLSHGAIVAREFGIPAVANIPGITEQLDDGAVLKIDGGRGVVSHL